MSKNNNVMVKDLGMNELREHVELLRRELLSLRLNAATSHVKDYSQYKKLRRAIAQGLTYLKQKETNEIINKGA